MWILFMFLIPVSAQTFYESQTSCDIPMTTVDECNNAGTALWEPDTNGITENSWSNQPPGCFRHLSYPDRWYFNTNSDSEAVCTDGISGGCACSTNKPVCSGQMNDCVYQGKLCEIFDDSRDIPCGALTIVESTSAQASCDMPISSLEDCQKANDILGWGTTARLTSQASRPPGCSKWGDYVWFSTKSSSSTACNVNSNVKCACLTDKPLCSSEVTANCVYQGEICEVFDDSYDLPCEGLNILESTTTCDIPIRSVDECTHVGTALGWTEDTDGAHSWSNSGRPSGCFNQGNWVFNPMETEHACDHGASESCACLTDKPKCSSEVTANCLYQNEICEVFDDSKDIPCGAFNFYESITSCEILVRSKLECESAWAALGWEETWCSSGCIPSIRPPGCSKIYNHAWWRTSSSSTMPCDYNSNGKCACLTVKPHCSSEVTTNCLYQNEICEVFDYTRSVPCEGKSFLTTSISNDLCKTISEDECRRAAYHLYGDRYITVLQHYDVNNLKGCSTGISGEVSFNPFESPLSSSEGRLSICASDLPACRLNRMTQCIYDKKICQFFWDSCIYEISYSYKYYNIDLDGHMTISKFNDETIHDLQYIAPFVTSISLYDNITHIPAHVFANSAITSLHIPDNIQYIGDEAFANNVNLKSVSVPYFLKQGRGVTGMGSNVFMGCSSLETFSFRKRPTGAVISFKSPFFNKEPSAQINMHDTGELNYFTSNDIELFITHEVSSSWKMANPFLYTVGGFRSAPAFVDTDNDGDMDLVIGRHEGGLSYYENTGNASNPSYTRRYDELNPFDGVAEVKSTSTPAFVDVDNDGDMDLVIGRGFTEPGDLKHYYENTGSASNPSYTRREGALNPFDGVADAGYYSAPAFVDVDDDGDMDLVIGREEGDLKHYYENTGSASNPSYTRREGALNPFDEVADLGRQSAPAFVDTDNDGDMDLVIGRNAGDLVYYENIGNANHANYTRRVSPLNPFSGMYVEAISKPAFVDSDNDGDMDLVIGRSSSGLLYYENTGSGYELVVIETSITAVSQSGSLEWYFDTQLDPHSYSLATVDLDGDNDDEIVITTPSRIDYYKKSGKLYRYRSNTLLPTPPLSTPNIAFVDVDRDDDFDYILSDNTCGIISYFENTGDKFTPQFEQQTNPCSVSSSCNVFAQFVGKKAYFLDYNNDGYDDFVLDGSVYLGGVEVFSNAMEANGLGIPVLENLIFEDKVPVGHFAVLANNIRYENGKQHESIDSRNNYPLCESGCMEIAKDGHYYGDVTGFNFSGISLANSVLNGVYGEVLECPSAMPPNWFCDPTLKRFIGKGANLTGVDLTSVDLSVLKVESGCPILPGGFVCAGGLIVPDDHMSVEDLETMYRAKQCS